MYVCMYVCIYVWSGGNVENVKAELDKGVANISEDQCDPPPRGDPRKLTAAFSKPLPVVQLWG